MSNINNENQELKKQEEWFSKARINSYSSPQEHDDNIRFIQEITDKIAQLEIFIRNAIYKSWTKTNRDACILTELKKQKQIDLLGIFYCLKQQVIPVDYLDECINDKRYADYKDCLKSIKKAIGEGNADYKQIMEDLINKVISSVSFGFWANIIRDNNNKIRDDDETIFFIEDKKTLLSRIEQYLDISYEKQIYNITNFHDKNYLDFVVLYLIKNLRNRAFHWENLLKVNQKGQSKISVSFKFENSRSKPLTIVSLRATYEDIEGFLNECHKNLFKLN